VVEVARKAEVRPREARHRQTENLSFAAYAHMRGIRVVRAQVWRKPTGVRYLFVFDDPPDAEHPIGAWDALLLDFANSEAQLYDASVRTLKKLCQRGED
jgi:hypothetical protein